MTSERLREHALEEDSFRRSREKVDQTYRVASRRPHLQAVAIAFAVKVVVLAVEPVDRSRVDPATSGPYQANVSHLETAPIKDDARASPYAKEQPVHK
jgi:hypothetical protein